MKLSNYEESIYKGYDVTFSSSFKLMQENITVFPLPSSLGHE